MIKKRVIPILQIKDEDLVKSRNYKNHSYVGDPLNAVRIFNQKQVDEIIIIDVEKYTKRKKINFEYIKNLASECRMPFSYGGGISDINDVDKLFNLGVEKITINSSTINNYSFINKISKNFGSQSIVVSIDINRNYLNQIKLYDWKLEKNINININNHISSCVENGAGEILINCVHKEGTLDGFDYSLFKSINTKISVPLIVNGGINSYDEIENILKFKDIDACAVGAFFIYYGPFNAVLISYLPEKKI